MSEDLVKSKEPLKIDHTPPARNWMDPTVELRKGTFGYPAALKHQKYLELPNAREWNPLDKDWKLPENWKEIILKGMKDRLEPIPVFPGFPGYLRAVRGLRRQVPLLHRLRRPEEHARPQGGAHALGLPKILHPGGEGFRKACRGEGSDRSRFERMVLLLLPVLRMSSLLRLLSLRYRHL